MEVEDLNRTNINIVSSRCTYQNHIPPLGVVEESQHDFAHA